jgi:type I restriction enzyme S subunit
MKFKHIELGDIFSIKKGKKVIPTEQNKDSIRYIQIEDLRTDDNIKFCNPEEKNVIANGNDIIIAWDGANAGTVSYGLNGAIGSTLAILHPKNNDNINISYIGKFLQSKFKYLRDNCTGATIPHIQKQVLLNLIIPLPLLETQEKIVDVLDKAQELINKRKEQIEKLEEFIQSVFLDMFGYIARNTKQWTSEKLGENTLLVSSGSTPKGGSKSYLSEGIPLIRSQNILMNKIDFDNIAYISDETHNKMRRSHVYYNDVLLNITGASIGRIAVYKNKEKVANVNQHVCIIRLNQKINPYYLSFTIATPYFQNLINKQNAGATRQALNYSQIKEFDILIPPIDLQNKFASIVEKTEQQKELLQKSLTEMENNFNSLMHRAFKGDLF